MSLKSQLLIAIAAALAATALIVAVELMQQPLLLAVVVVAACCAAPLLAARPGGAQPPEAVTGSGREEGEIKWFNVSKGFGFIRRQNGEEIFVHFRSIRGPNRDRRQLRDGQRVSFVVVDSDKGPQAEDVEALG